MEPATIIASQLTRQFDECLAISDVTFEVPAGTLFACIGPSGCGKTTLVHLLTGIQPPTAGSATVLGKSPLEFTDGIRRKIGYVPQGQVFYEDLTVWENLRFSASLYGMWPFRRKRMKSILALLDLLDDRKVLAARLSADRKLRLSLACALIHNPELIFIDEPAVDADPVSLSRLWDFLQGLKKEGRTLFVTTRHVSAAACCDLVGWMANGRLTMVGTPDDLRRKVFGGDMVDLNADGPEARLHLSDMSRLPFVKRNAMFLDEDRVRVIVEEASAAIPALTEWCARENITVRSIQQYIPPFDEVFIKEAEASRA